MKPEETIVKTILNKDTREYFIQARQTKAGNILIDFKPVKESMTRREFQALVQDLMKDYYIIDRAR